MTNVTAVCNKCMAGLLLPFPLEAMVPCWLRATVHLVGMLWLFLAVSEAADIFMRAIDVITSKTRTIKAACEDDPRGYREMTVQVWDDTVANLSLMALGSSAPEILLSVIEIVGQDFKAGDLGPGTILGSAAFNLFMISAVCIMAIPDGEVRRIDDFGVFAVTSFTGIAAYGWMAFVLLVTSPDEITIEEGAITLAFFPLLLVVAYFAGNGCKCCRVSRVETDSCSVAGILFGVSGTVVNRNAVLETLDVGENTKDVAAKLAVDVIKNQSHSHGFYKVNKTKLQGMSRRSSLYNDAKNKSSVSTPAQVSMPSSRKSITHESRVYSSDESSFGTDVSKRKEREDGPVVSFVSPNIVCLENEGNVDIQLNRGGDLKGEARVRVFTSDGDARAGQDYVAVDTIVTFAPNVNLAVVPVQIVNDDIPENDEVFFVNLDVLPNTSCRLGTFKTCAVEILDDDIPGTFEFQKPSIVCKNTHREARIPVVRSNGAAGRVTVEWETKDITAMEGHEYFGRKGSLVFGPTEQKKDIVIGLDVEINAISHADDFKCFEIALKKIDIDMGSRTTILNQGPAMGKNGKTIVTIVSDMVYEGMIKTIQNQVQDTVANLEEGSRTYADKFREAMNVNGGDIEGATKVDYVFHFLNFFWKVLFAFIPPCHWLDGWLSFFVSLLVVGLLTALIGDMAKTFGCLVGIGDGVTAITLVALGTSMPDTFASRTAALLEKTADSSIGNVNGSNAVNVFLGLGLPWLMAAIYHKDKPGGFVVPSGSLGFSVVTYTGFAIVAILLFLFRRRAPSIRGELGGPRVSKCVSAGLFFILWVVYIVLSILEFEGFIFVPGLSGS